MIIKSPKGESYKYSFSLKFECTNNVVEYEALLLGLKVFKHKINKIRVLGNSKLVVSQVKERYVSKMK